MLESSAPIKTEFQNSEMSPMVDSTVTSECGIQAASDTVSACAVVSVVPLSSASQCVLYTFVSRLVALECHVCWFIYSLAK